MLTAIEYVGYTEGGSAPLIVRADDGQLYLTKLMGNRQGDCTLINEHVGAFVLRFMGANVAENTIINVTESFIRSNNLRQLPNGSGFIAGPAFASLLVGQARMMPNGRVQSANLPQLSLEQAEAIVNPDSFLATMIADIVLDNVDTRQVIFEPVDQGYRALMVDQGCCLGGFPWVVHDSIQAQPGFRLSLNARVTAKIFQSCSEASVDRHLLQLKQLTAQMILEAAAQAPAIWFDRTNLRAAFELAVKALFERMPQVKVSVTTALEKIRLAGIIVYVSGSTVPPQ